VFYSNKSLPLSRRSAPSVAVSAMLKGIAVVGRPGCQ
jgi:hypothetical protein